MIYASNSMRLGSRVGRWGATICFILALIAIALLTRDAMGQEIQRAEPFDVIGTLVDDESGRALVGAFVSLTGSDWGSVTDQRGRFRIPDVYAGPVSLTVEQLAYVTLEWSGEVSAQTGMIELRMRPQPLVLEGLQVVADRFRSRRNGVATSVFVLDREALATSVHYTVLDHLASRIGGAREPCSALGSGGLCLRLRGRTVVPSIYVDEAPVLGGLDYLAALSPHELYMVEIYGNGRHIRAYTPRFMERAAKIRLQPIALLF